MTQKRYQIFGVQIGNAKMTINLQIHPAAPLIKYHQKKYTSCCLSSLASDFHYIGDKRYVLDIVKRIEEKLTPQTENYKNIIHFANANMKNRRRIKGEQNLRYNLTIWKLNDAFDILDDMSSFSLVQIMDSLGNVNHTISIVGHWIFDSNYNKSLFLTQ